MRDQDLASFEYPAEQRIKQAMDIIPTLRRRDVQLAINSVEEQKKAIASGRFGAMTKGQKKACAEVEAALRRLQIALRAVPRVYEFPLDDNELTKLRNSYDQAARLKSVAQRYRSIDYGKRQAAKEAVRLLKKCEVPLTTTKSGLFCRLAAILYGKPDANLFHVCRTVKAG